MHKMNDLELNVRNLMEAKVLNLDVTLATLVNAGALSGLEPWEVFCGNGWVLRRKGPFPDPIRLGDLELIRNVIREELNARVVKQE